MVSSHNQQRRRSFLKTASAVAVGVGLAGCPGGGSDEGRESLSVGVVHSSPIDDFGWSQAHHNDIEAVIDENDRIDLGDVTETVAFGDYETIAGEIAAGHDVVISTSNGYVNSGGIEVSQQHSDTFFLTYNTPDPPDELPENHLTYNTLHQAASQMPLGYVAGRLTEADTIGLVAALPVQVIIHGVRGAICGMKAANPDAEMLVNWMDAFYDPETERQNAEAHIDDGADVLMHVTDSAMPGIVAEENGIWCTGCFMDQSPAAPDGFVTSSVTDQTAFLAEAFDAMLAGEWEDFRERFPDNHPWAPKDYPGTNPAAFEHTDSDDGFHPDTPDEVVSDSTEFLERVSAYEDDDVRFPKIWDDNSCPDGTGFELDVPR